MTFRVNDGAHLTEQSDGPAILLVPGLHDSGPQHWQSHWEREFPQARRVDLGMWDNPNRNSWVNQLNLAIHRAARPVILVAHSLGCHAVSWWAEYEQPAFGEMVAGALLVAPADVDRPGIDPRIARFAPVMPGKLPFRSILAASQNDPFIEFGQAKKLARTWGSRLIDAGPVGHINADSGIADWNYGKYLLRHLISEVSPQKSALLKGRAFDSMTATPARQLAFGR
jgi:uncharacterized protein